MHIAIFVKLDCWKLDKIPIKKQDDRFSPLTLFKQKNRMDQ